MPPHLGPTSTHSPRNTRGLLPCTLSWILCSPGRSGRCACFQSFPASRSFPMRQLLSSGGQNIRASVSTSVLPMNTQDRFPLGWTGWISVQETLKSLCQHHSSKASVLRHSAFFIFKLLHPYMTTGKTIMKLRYFGHLM